jgi:hypothetical protein
MAVPRVRPMASTKRAVFKIRNPLAKPLSFQT